MGGNRGGAMNPYVTTRYGHKVHFLNPKPSEFDIRDIAHALSRIPRFNGHTIKPYYVLQHVCICCDAAPENAKREALAHDWAEAYESDLPSPLKVLVPQYRDIEQRLERAIARRFNHRYPYPEAVKEVDMRLLITEMRDLTSRHDWKTLPFAPLAEKIMPWDSAKCKREFYRRYHALYSLAK